MYGCKKISKKSIDRLISLDFKDSLSVNLNLYKGATHHKELSDFYIFTPNSKNRPSKSLNEHGNFYNLLFNNLDSWKEYPKREKSIILTTNSQTANCFLSTPSSSGTKFSKKYKLIPKYGSLIAVAPKSDIWYSFETVLKGFSIRGVNTSLTNINSYFNEILASYEIDIKCLRHWDMFKHALKKIKENKKGIVKVGSREAHSIHTAFLEQNNILEYLNDIFDPSRNGFKLINYDTAVDSKDYPNNEMWLQDPSVLLEINEANKFMSEK